jgi:hypothetical protein
MIAHAIAIHNAHILILKTQSRTCYSLLHFMILNFSYFTRDAIWHVIILEEDFVPGIGGKNNANHSNT